MKLAVTFKYEYWTQGAGWKNYSDAIQRPQANPNGSESQQYVPDRTVMQFPPISSLIPRLTNT